MTQMTHYDNVFRASQMQQHWDQTNKAFQVNIIININIVTLLHLLIMIIMITIMDSLILTW